MKPTMKQKIMCKLGFHRWGLWKEIKRGEICRVIDGQERMVGFFIKQESYCECCNAIRVHVSKARM